ncbi:hypothetical protein ACOXH8_45905 [Nannocystis pusilla]
MQEKTEMKTECVLVVVALAACEVEGQLDPDAVDSSTSGAEDEDVEVADPRIFRTNGAGEDEDTSEHEDETGDFQTDRTEPLEVKEPCTSGSPACGPPPTARPI